MSDSSHTTDAESWRQESQYSFLTAAGVIRRLRTPAWLARTMGAGLCVVSVGFIIAFGVAFGSGGEIALVTRPLSMQIALVFPSLIFLFTFGTVIGAVLAWWHRYWSLSARIHQTILALLGLGFSWQLITLGFLTV